MLKKYREILKIFYDKELMHYSASLSFYTILSIIPVLLISFSIFTKMPSFDGYYKKIKLFIFENLLPTQQEIFASHIEEFLSNSFGLGIVGICAIIITSIMFFGNFEYVVTRLTNTKPRTFWQNLSSYWTLITLSPLGLGTSFYISNVIQNLLNKTEFTNWINLVAILPYLIIWAIFAITYAVSINAQISAKNILISSFLASIFWNFSKILFIQYAIHNKTYLNIYGSFSILLFFFIWIYISWIIFLFGLKIYIFLVNFKIRTDV